MKKSIIAQPSLPSDLPGGEWSQQAKKVLKERYLKKDEEGKVIETPDEMCWRVAWDIAQASKKWGQTRKTLINKAREFYLLLSSKKFLPNSPTLMNAGMHNGMQYSACFVLPVGDSLVEIFDALKYQALIHQTGGGTGFAFSRLRPKGSIVKSSRGVASGPISFMKIFDAATNEIKQGGKRRGANMGILRVDHPDILEFIHCKEEGGITNFNISVGITDKFMEAYKNNTEYDLIKPHNQEVTGSLSAQRVFNEIAQAAWASGDPGIVYLDRLNTGSSNPVPVLGPIEATNPCGEQPLYPYDACNLGSIFLPYFVKEGEVDWAELGRVTKLAVEFLDNVIEANPFPIPEIRKTVDSIRRIGLGVGGWADMLVAVGIPYNSNEALVLAEKLMGFIQEKAEAETESLAKVRGAFPLWNKSIYKHKAKRRNATVTTIAPTGSISIIADTSSGIEPLFALAYQHEVHDKHLDRTLTFFNRYFEAEIEKRGLSDLKGKVLEKGSLHEIEAPEDLKKIFVTAHDINYEWHIKTQAVFQKFTENAVSKTINLPNSATVEDVKKAYLLSWEENCKGVTIFRDGSKGSQVLNVGKTKTNTEETSKKSAEIVSWDRPMKLTGATYKIKTPVGTAFITVNEDELGNPMEVFINIGRAGSDIQAMAEALGRVISKSLKFTSLLSPRERAYTMVDQLRGIGGRRSVGFGPNKILSLPDAIATALASHMGIKVNGHIHLDEEVNGKAKLTTDLVLPQPTLSLFTQPDEVVGDICPSCGASAFVYEEGCSKCHACGHSEC